MQRIVAIEGKNKNAMQKEALLSLKEHYDMDEVSNLSGFDRRLVNVPKFCSGDCPKRGSCRYQHHPDRPGQFSYLRALVLIPKIWDKRRIPHDRRVCNVFI